MTSPGLLLCGFLFALLLIYPEETNSVVERCVLELQIMWLNFRLKRAQWRLYKQLCKDAETLGLPQPPPFKFTPIQERGK